MSQRTILITGCSSGIGFDAAHGLRAAGWRVFASCRKPEDCARLTNMGFESPMIDYRDQASISDGFQYVMERTGGRLDALFNNGAFGLPGAVEDLPTEALRDIFEVNLFGWHSLTRMAIAPMRAQGHGRILQCSSVLGFVPLRWRGAYVATKYALEGLTDCLRLELSDTQVHVALVTPGPITSRLRENSVPHFERWIDWENSSLAHLYKERLLVRLYKKREGKDPFELPPSAVTKVVLKALTSPSPAPRYFITKPTFAMNLARRLLPTRVLDKIILKGA